MNILTVHVTTEVELSKFNVALLTVPVPIESVTWDMERGLASVDLPEEYDQERLDHCLSERNLEVFTPEPAPEVDLGARKAFWQMIGGVLWQPLG